MVVVKVGVGEMCSLGMALQLYILVLSLDDIVNHHMPFPRK